MEQKIDKFPKPNTKFLKYQQKENTTYRTKMDALDENSKYESIYELIMNNILNNKSSKTYENIKNLQAKIKEKMKTLSYLVIYEHTLENFENQIEIIRMDIENSVNEIINDKKENIKEIIDFMNGVTENISNSKNNCVKFECNKQFKSQSHNLNDKDKEKYIEIMLETILPITNKIINEICSRLKIKDHVENNKNISEEIKEMIKEIEKDEDIDIERIPPLIELDSYYRNMIKNVTDNVTNNVTYNELTENLKNTFIKTMEDLSTLHIFQHALKEEYLDKIHDKIKYQITGLITSIVQYKKASKETISQAIVDISKNVNINVRKEMDNIISKYALRCGLLDKLELYNSNDEKNKLTKFFKKDEKEQEKDIENVKNKRNILTEEEKNKILKNIDYSESALETILLIKDSIINEVYSILKIENIPSHEKFLFEEQRKIIDIILKTYEIDKK